MRFCRISCFRRVVSFEEFGQPEVSYWIGRGFWGKGIASLRVLQKCGFKISGEDKGFANARGAEVEEFILVLGADEGGAAQ